MNAGSGLATLEELGPADGPVVLYFHGTEARPDLGPPRPLLEQEGVRLLLVTRPGYCGTPAQPDATLTGVARAAIAAAGEDGIGELVSVGWSGGGPYALASAVVAPEVVRGVGLLGSWAPMAPPDPRLPRSVRHTMRAARHLPRPALRWALQASGRSSPGQLDDIRRIARPWGFTPADVARRAPVVAWHSSLDPEVPRAPWEATAGLELKAPHSEGHEPDDDTWREVLRWACIALRG
jgi:pimeloyl-ACP methyl ester carboxylesterase